MTLSKRVTAPLAALSLLALGACSNMSDMEQRMLSGGALGAAGGAAVTAVAGGSLVGGAIVGGAIGTAAGYLTAPKNQRR
ncbi:hypothetical protein [Telmatospirillum sp. J64-1]|uniref:hypothetical protein n=1 Tax=Telmatospirillum sp. J64-1 TaxID=2502183 RepID=UPI00115F4B13|nr:hypothetical protein [Telmatospirillum sp. J64-1]